MASLWMASCGNNSSEIVKHWQMTDLRTPKMDSTLEMQKKEIDTMTVMPPESVAFYGTDNLDTLKERFKMVLKDYEADRRIGLMQTSIQFLKDGTVLMYSGEQVDTQKWRLEGKDQLILSPRDVANAMGPSEDTSTILKLTSNELKIKIKGGPMMGYSYATFRVHKDADTKRAKEVRDSLLKVNSMERHEENAMETEMDFDL